MLNTPSSAEVKNVWSYTFAPPICVHDTDSDNFTRLGPKDSGLTNIGRAKWKVLRGINSAIYGEVNVSVSVCVEIKRDYISLFHRAFQFPIYNGPTNALICNKSLIQMSHIKALKITPPCFDHQLMSTCLSTQYNMQNE
jgi:hypothetical protein